MPSVWFNILLVVLSQALWHYMPAVLERLSELAHLFPSSIHARSTTTTCNICITEITIEILSSVCGQVPTDTELFMNFILQTADDTKVQTLGPFTRESEWIWKLSGHFEIRPQVTSFSLVVNIDGVSKPGRLHIGSVEFREGRLQDMRKVHKRSSIILRSRDDQPILKTIVGIVRAFEEHSDDIIEPRLGSGSVLVVYTTESLSSAHTVHETFLLSWLKAVLPPPIGFFDKSALLHIVGKFFLRKFKQKGMLPDIEKAIKYLQHSVLLTADGHPYKPTRLNDLGSSFLSRFDMTWVVTDIEEAIKILQQAVSLTPVGHPGGPTHLFTLGKSFQRRFEQQGVLSDIEEAIRKRRQAISLIPDGHSDLPAALNELANSFQCLFERTGILRDIEESIKILQQAVSSTPDGHVLQASCLASLGNSFQLRFSQTGATGDVEEAIKYLQQAVSLTPEGHPKKLGRLSNLGNSFRTRFEQTDALSDIAEAIRNLEHASSISPNNHPHKPGCLTNLGCSFLVRFKRTGALSDIDNAIMHLQQAVLLIPDKHPNKPTLLSNLGSSFHVRFGQTGVLGDIEEAIKVKQQAVLLTPHGHPNEAGHLTNLGNSFQTRFSRTGVLGDVEEAIKNHRQALLLTPDGHPDESGRLSNLGNSLQSRFQRTGVLVDIEEAITNFRQAALLTPDSLPGKPVRLFNLGNSLTRRFEQTQALDDIDDAIKNMEQGLSLVPHGHPDKSKFLSNLGCFLMNRFELTKVPCDLDAALSHLHSVSTSSGNPPAVRLHASREWARALVANGDLASALRAYRCAVDLIQQIAWIGDPISARHFQLTIFDDLAREAAVSALDAGQPDLALEWLEQGCSIIWNQMLNLCSSADHLREAAPDLHADFTLISSQLRTAAIRRQGTEQSLDIKISLEEETRQHHRLAEKWCLLVDQIRLLPNLEDFLLPRRVSSLKEAAEFGPIITINVHKRRCDALALLPGGGLRHIPLDRLSYRDVMEMLGWLKEDFTDSSVFQRESRARKPFKAVGLRLTKILSLLFSNVMCPILQGLDIMVGERNPSELPRIWLCPTGPLTFLPLHAAGVDTPKGRDDLSNYVISSYIPTVQALLEARAGHRQPFRRLLGIAMINNPLHHRLNPLPNAQMELERIRDLFPADSSNQSFQALRNEQATREHVLTEMAAGGWVHLACHAMQDMQEPTQSGLWLHDGPLTISHLVSKRFANADLAFLSACQTATGDENLPDEALHITAAMLGAGYKSVIGTMWSIPDEVAPIVAAKVYGKLFAEEQPNSEMAARALHESIQELRQSGNYSLYSWVPFVHYGL